MDPVAFDPHGAAVRGAPDLPPRRRRAVRGADHRERAFRRGAPGRDLRRHEHPAAPHPRLPPAGPVGEEPAHATAVAAAVLRRHRGPGEGVVASRPADRARRGEARHVLRAACVPACDGGRRGAPAPERARQPRREVAPRRAVRRHSVRRVPDVRARARRAVRELFLELDRALPAPVLAQHGAAALRRPAQRNGRSVAARCDPRRLSLDGWPARALHRRFPRRDADLRDRVEPGAVHRSGDPQLPAGLVRRAARVPGDPTTRGWHP